MADFNDFFIKRPANLDPNQFQDQESYLQAFSRMKDANAGRILQYFVYGFLGFGLILGNFHDTWVLAIGLGGFLLLIYMVVTHLMKNHTWQKYLTSIIFGIMTVQFFYQMQGLPAINYVFFVGFVLLLLYGEWQVLVPLVVIGLFHHSLFNYWASQGEYPDFFGIGHVVTSQSLIFQTLLLAITGVIGGLIAQLINHLRINSALSEYRIQNVLAKEEKNIRFAQEIASGNYDAEYELSEEDSLGSALVEMSKNLKSSADEDQRRNWSISGIYKTEEILRKANNDIDDLANKVISHLVNYMGAKQGGIFVLNDEDAENKFLELKGCYAYGRKKYQQKKMDVGEGLIGEAFLEQETIYLKEIPEDYLHITSGLGDAPPGNLIIVPLKMNEEVVGAIELASFKAFADHEKDFLEKVSESIASTIINSKRNAETNKLLQDSQSMTEQLRAQEEEMRQNMEELQATQENLERKNEEQEKTRQELSKEKYMFDSLLSSIPDAVYFKDKESKFLRVSKALSEKHGLNDPAEMIGLSDFDFFTEDHARPAYEGEMEIIRTGKPLIDLEEKETWEDGTESWVSTTKMPLYDMEGHIVGTFGISRDISKSKNAEKELRKSQGFLHNIINKIPEPIFVKNRRHQIELANQAWADLVNVNLESMQGKKIDEVLNASEKSMKSLMEQEKKVFNSGEESTGEITLSLDDGKNITLKSTKTLFVDKNGQEYLVAINYDISGNKPVEG